jgi:phosphoglycerol transferase
MLAGGAAMFAVKFGIGYLLAGEPGLSLFGPFYGGGAHAASAGDKLRLLKPAFVISRAHLMLLALAFGVPLAILLQSVLRPARRAQAGQPELVGIYTLLMLGAGAGMTILYTATLAYPGTNEGLRMHLRYYSFVFPMLWVVAAAFDRRDERRPVALRWTLALLLTAVLAIAIVKLPTYALNAVDGPEAFALRLDQPLSLVILALQVAALLLWAAGRASAQRLFLFVVTPLFIASGIVENNYQLGLYGNDQAADMAGKAAHRLVPPAERGKITVAGSELGQVMRAQFHIDNPDTAMLVLPQDAPIEPYQLPVRNNWLLVFGKHALPAGLTPIAGNDHYALVHTQVERRIVGSARFNEPFGPNGLLAGAEGVADIELFGRWSNAKQVVLHFNAPLPQHAFIVLKAWAYGDNAELPFTLRIGGSSAQFRVSGSPQELGLRLDTDGQQRSLTIEVPHPVSPASYGDPRDPRLLGIALAEIEISTPVN